jgi:hypothetical protein
MRRSLVVRFDALQFQRLHGGGLAPNLLFQAFEQFDLPDDDRVQLFHLMFEMREVRFKPVQAPGIFFSHEIILPARRREVEAVDGRIHQIADCAAIAFSQSYLK